MADWLAPIGTSPFTGEERTEEYIDYLTGNQELGERITDLVKESLDALWDELIAINTSKLTPEEGKALVEQVQLQMIEDLQKHERRDLVAMLVTCEGRLKALTQSVDDTEEQNAGLIEMGAMTMLAVAIVEAIKLKPIEQDLDDVVDAMLAVGQGGRF